MLVMSCGVCGEIGHNRSTCQESSQAPRESAKRFRKRARLAAIYPGLYEKLGKFPNTQIAAEFGLSRERVRQLREELGVPKFEAELPSEVESLLGKVPDRELVRKFGVSLYLVSATRKAKNIKAFGDDRDYYEKLLGDPSAKVGVISDPKVAKNLGITTNQVLEYRKRHGIPPAVLSPKCKDFKPLDRDLIAKLFKEGLSDEEIAEALGASKGTVQLIRSQELRLLKRPGRKK